MGVELDMYARTYQHVNVLFELRFRIMLRITLLLNSSEGGPQLPFRACLGCSCYGCATKLDMRFPAVLLIVRFHPAVHQRTRT